MLDDNNIKNKFNNPSLDNEDWLQPNEGVYDLIAGELFEENKKKRVAIWLWLGIGLLVLSSLAIGYYFGMANTRAFTDADQNLPSSVEEIATLLPHESSELAPTPSSKARSDERAAAINKSGQSNPAIIDDHKSIPYSQASESRQVNHNYESAKTKSPSKIRRNNTISKTPNVTTTNANNLNTNPLFNVISSNDSFLNEPADRINNLIARTDVASQELARQKIALKTLSWLPISAFPNVDHKPRLNPIPSMLIDFPQHKGLLNAINLYAGFSIWDIQLNENYNSALSPADFRHSRGTGFLTGLELKRSLGSKFSLNTNLQYERVTIESGHNSAYTYELGQESSPTQNLIDLPMATPLGFVEAPVIINRLSTNPSSTEYELTLDLSNRHRLQNLDLGLGLDYEVLKKTKLKVVLNLGGGWNRLLAIKNELYQVTTGNQDFEAVGSTLVSSPSNLNKNRIYYTLGTRVSYNISKHNNIGLYYQHKRDLNAIYKENDFNTRLIRHNISLDLSTRF